MRVLLSWYKHSPTLPSLNTIILKFQHEGVRRGHKHSNYSKLVKLVSGPKVLDLTVLPSANKTKTNHEIETHGTKLLNFIETSHSSQSAQSKVHKKFTSGKRIQNKGN